MTDRQWPPYKYYYEKVTGTGKYGKFSESLLSVDNESIKNPTRGGMTESIVESEVFANLLNERMKQKSGGQNRRLAIILGMLTKDKENPIKANIPSEDRSQFSQEKYKFFLDAPFEISNRCCNIMKKNPAHSYHKKTGRNPIIATMASESRLRTQKWIENGCNGFDLKIPTSNPMSFWTEQDVLLYIKLYGKDMVKRKINNHDDVMFYGNRIVDRKTGKTIESKEFYNPICSVYKKIVIDYKAEGNVEGQMNISELSEDMGVFDIGNRPLKTTGCSRTGCVLCGFGCHLESEDDARFVRLKETHFGMYALLDKAENNGFTYRQAIDWVNEHGNMNIRY